MKYFAQNQEFSELHNYQLMDLLKKAENDINHIERCSSAHQNEPMIIGFKQEASATLRNVRKELAARKANKAASKQWGTKWLKNHMGEDEADYSYHCFRPLPCGTKVQIWRSHTLTPSNRGFDGYEDNYEGWFDKREGRTPHDASWVLSIEDARALWVKLTSEVCPYENRRCHTPIWK